MINKSVAQTLQEPAKRRLPSSIPLRISALCLTSAVTAVNYTNYGPLIPVLRTDLHINNGQAGLMSTLLFLGLAVMYIPAGVLADRYGQRPVLIGSSILLAGGGMLLPLFPNFTWILFCRIITGFGAGGAFVAGAGVAASMGKHSPLAQGLYGGSVQIGSGLGLLFTPFLYGWFGWRGAFFFWGLLAILVVITWLIVNDGQEEHTPTRVDVRAGLRSPAVWTLGLSHMGTFGLGNAMAAWIAVYLAHQYGLSLGLAATLGSLSAPDGDVFSTLRRYLDRSWNNRGYSFATTGNDHGLHRCSFPGSTSTPSFPRRSWYGFDCHWSNYSLHLGLQRGCASERRWQGSSPGVSKRDLCPNGDFRASAHRLPFRVHRQF